MQGDGRKSTRLHRSLLFVMLALALCMPGCKGCSCRRTPPKQKTAEEREKERLEREARLREQAKKKPIQELRYASLPHGPLGKFPELGKDPQVECYVKPGHWTATTASIKANNYDISGKLELSAGERTALPGMPFSIATERPVALPRGQAKSFDSIFFTPDMRAPPPMLGTLQAKTGVSLPPLKTGSRRMPAYQYHFVVLARYPELYGYLKTLDSVRPPNTDYYRISLISPGQRTPIPSQPLLWTSTAFVLWDDADPDALSLDQQVALLDWLHWGGQLIISGPETLDALQASFLADYLPAKSDGSFPLTEADFAEINSYWTLPVRDMPGPPLAPASQWSGVKLEKHPEAQYVPTTGRLLVERRIGRGRVVVSAFKLGGREIGSWPGWDGFFNGCLMRRPSRRFDGSAFLGQEYTVTWADAPPGMETSSLHFDTERLCRLRYFSRDTGRPLSSENVDAIITPEEELGEGYDPDVFGTAQTVSVKNLGGWNDFNAVANGARSALSEAAGIEVPDRSFVVWIVAGYLVVLVPVNWLVFRLLGRVEWAWIAAPVIAVICAIVVIRQAQLDIGFVRSDNQIAIVELQGDYPRAHVTRYSAYYTSLGTGYDFEFEDPSAQIMPFPTSGAPEDDGLSMGERPERVTYRYGSGVHLEGLRVRSSRTQMVHSEQVLDLGGGLQWREPAPGMHRLVNRTGYRLRDVGVVRKSEDGRLLTAWLGTVEPEEAADAAGRWKPMLEGSGGLWADRRDRVPQTGYGTKAGDLTLRPLVLLAEQTAEMQAGDVRLVAWTDEPLPGMSVRPSAPQKRHLTLIVAHLQYGLDGEPGRDRNTRFEFLSQKPVYREGANRTEESEGEDDLQLGPGSIQE